MVLGLGIYFRVYCVGLGGLFFYCSGLNVWPSPGPVKGYKNHNLSCLRGIVQGNTIGVAGVIQGDTRSLDYGPHKRGQGR